MGFDEITLASVARCLKEFRRLRLENIYSWTKNLIKLNKVTSIILLLNAKRPRLYKKRINYNNYE